MSTYAIGDIHGCYASLEALLERIDYRPGRDRLWLVGDLVNRGPRSLDVLRWAAGSERVTAVLGNHDLNLLARASGLRARRPLDTLEEVLRASDRDELLDWLRRRPLLHREGRWVMVHAGLLPRWDIDAAARLAAEAERRLRGEDWVEALAAWRRSKVDGSRAERQLDPDERFAQVLRGLTSIRMVTGRGAMDTDYSGPPGQAPDGLEPWYEARTIRRETTLLFGHWSALGIRRGRGWTALDGGCVWHRSLAALRLEDQRLFEQPAVEPVDPSRPA